MEDSEKRKERLKAMRVEAAEAEASPNFESTMSAHLSNPFTESSATPSLQENSPGSARFDFYTNPMAAFSGNKRKSQKTYQNPPNYISPPLGSPSPGPRNLDMTPSPSHQFYKSYSPDQRMYEAPLPYQNSSSWRSPVGMARPFPRQLETPPPIWNRSGGRAGYLPPDSSRVGCFPSPGFGRGGSPSPNSGRGSAHPFSPSPGFGRGDSPSPNSGRGSGYPFSPNPGFGCGGSPIPNSGRGSGYPFSPSPGFGQGGSPSDFGRGGRHWFRNSPSPGSGRGGGRGRGSHGSVSARERPELFYNKSMVEDPWRFLKPVVRKLTVPVERSWLPKSISMTKDRNSEASLEFNSGSSLAEYLAEVANDVKNI